MPITYTDLAYFDDLLVDCLIDRLFYWASIRKVREYKPIRGIPEDEIIHIIQDEVITPDKPSVSNALTKFIAIRPIQIFLSRFQTNLVRNEFDKHAKRYLQIYLKDCGFNVEVTDRYYIRSNMLEACVIAKRPFEEGENIRYLSGFLVQLTDDEEEELNKSNDKDFSIINSTRRGRNCLMLGPARFVNHDCEPNSRFVSSGMNMALHAQRRISIGEEITVEYSENYFGKKNRECLCATCERMARNGWDPNKNWEESDSEDEDEDGETENDDEGEVEGEAENDREVDEHHDDDDCIITGTNLLQPSISPSLSPSPILFSSRGSTPLSSIEPETSSNDEKRSLRPRKAIPIDPKTIPKRSTEEIFKQCHEYQKKFYLAPFLAENKDDVLKCNNCKTPFLKPKEDKLVLRSLIRNYCPRCHRQILIYNSFWPSVKESPTKIELYRSPFEQEEDEEEEETTDEDEPLTTSKNRRTNKNSATNTTDGTSKEYFRGKRRTKFLPAVEEPPAKTSTPRRICSWIARRQKEDPTTITPASTRKRRRFDIPETPPSRHSARLANTPSPKRKRTPSRRFLESL